MLVTVSRPIFTLAVATAVLLTNELKAQDSVKQLPKVVVTAQQDGIVDGYKTNISRSSTRTNTKLIDTPQSVSVVNQQQIQDQNITNMEEAARYVPGVMVHNGEGNRDQITIRGNNTTADFFVDGARDDAQYFRDFYNVERIEFLKGPNAMAFGRGGSGGVVNRVTKIADGSRKRQLTLSGGSFNNRRAQFDIGDRINNKLSLRLNTMYEKTGTFRQFGDIERYGFNPNATITLSKSTDINVGYEYFRDKRLNDRGIPSQNGTAYVTKPKTYFGNPNENVSDSETNSIYSTITHDFNPTLQLKNLTRYNKNSKFYQNVYASGAVNSSGNFNLGAYNATVERNSVTNQTDLTKKFSTGSIKHTALLGSEVTYQHSRVLRNTGYFNGSTSKTISASNPLDFSSVSYSQSSSGNDNNGTSDLSVFGIYTQDQIELNKNIQLVGGLRYDRFEMGYDNNRNNSTFKRTDGLLSPRAGIILKPQENLSLYTSYSVSYLPSSGDQFTTLSSATAILKPEKMQNYEVGAKWDVNPSLNFTAALYQLNRTNSPVSDPNNAGFFLMTGKSRTNGLELSANGKITNKWQMIAGYSYQEAEILSSTSSATAGKRVALVPKNRLSLWNKYDFGNSFGAAIGVINQSSQFAGADNTVRLKGFTRFDGALYYKITPKHRLQINVENIFDHGYILTAHNNNNIQPGSTRAFKAALISEF